MTGFSPRWNTVLLQFLCVQLPPQAGAYRDIEKNDNEILPRSLTGGSVGSGRSRGFLPPEITHTLDIQKTRSRFDQ